MLLKQSSPIAVINKSIENGWIGLFKIKDDSRTAQISYHDQNLRLKLTEIGFKPDNIDQAFDIAKNKFSLDPKTITRGNYAEIIDIIKRNK